MIERMKLSLPQDGPCSFAYHLQNLLIFPMTARSEINSIYCGQLLVMHIVNHQLAATKENR